MLENIKAMTETSKSKDLRTASYYRWLKTGQCESSQSDQFICIK